MMLTNALTDFCELPLSKCSRIVASLFFFFRNVHDFFARTGNDFFKIIRRAMKFLRADDQIYVGQFINQFLSATLGHAAHETEHNIRTVFANVCGEVCILPIAFCSAKSRTLQVLSRITSAVFSDGASS